MRGEERGVLTIYYTLLFFFSLLIRFFFILRETVARVVQFDHDSVFLEIYISIYEVLRNHLSLIV